MVKVLVVDGDGAFHCKFAPQPAWVSSMFRPSVFDPFLARNYMIASGRPAVWPKCLKAAETVWGYGP